MSRIAKHVMIVSALCLLPAVLYAQEAQHVLGGLKILITAFFVGLAVITCSVINFIMDNKIINLITLLVSMSATIYFATVGYEFSVFNFAGILISGIGWLSVIKYIRNNS